MRDDAHIILVLLKVVLTNFEKVNEAQKLVKATVSTVQISSYIVKQDQESKI